MKSEVKLLVPGSHWKRLRKAAGIDGGYRHEVWFFDSAAHELVDRGVVLRARVGREESDTTVKVRGVDVTTAKDLARRLGEERGFKLENDASEASSVIAASYTVEVDPDRRKAAPDLFAVRQLVLLGVVNVTVPWHELIGHGPIRATSFDVDEHDLDVTRWRIRKDALIEVSRRHAAPWTETLSELRDLLGRWGIPTSGLPGGKTRWALDRLA